MDILIKGVVPISVSSVAKAFLFSFNKFFYSFIIIYVLAIILEGFTNIQ